ncbi:MAG TPA: hypothetical protein DCP92_14190 [Nitrospiraceae bacterium]|nr:hypothetical protein [Nitrospiraceae bacterium]
MKFGRKKNDHKEILNTTASLQGYTAGKPLAELPQRTNMVREGTQRRSPAEFACGNLPLVEVS